MFNQRMGVHLNSDGNVIIAPAKVTLLNISEKKIGVKYSVELGYYKLPGYAKHEFCVMTAKLGPNSEWLRNSEAREAYHAMTGKTADPFIGEYNA